MQKCVFVGGPRNRESIPATSQNSFIQGNDTYFVHRINIGHETQQIAVHKGLGNTTTALKVIFDAFPLSVPVYEHTALKRELELTKAKAVAWDHLVLKVLEIMKSIEDAKASPPETKEKPKK